MALRATFSEVQVDHSPYPEGLMPDWLGEYQGMALRLLPSLYTLIGIFVPKKSVYSVVCFANYRILCILQAKRKCIHY